MKAPKGYPHDVTEIALENPRMVWALLGSIVADHLDGAVVWEHNPGRRGDLRIFADRLPDKAGGPLRLSVVSVVEDPGASSN